MQLRFLVSLTVIVALSVGEGHAGYKTAENEPEELEAEELHESEKHPDERIRI